MSPSRLRERAVRVRGAKIPGSGGWTPYLLTLVVLVLIWMALWGSASLIVILIGIVVSALILLLFPLPTMEFRFGLHPWRTLVLLVRFLWDVVVASVQVGWLAIRPRLPQSEVTTVQLASDSDLLEALTALAVSLVPGSLIVDADSENRTLTIHVLDAEHRSMDDFADQVLAQERRIRLALGDGTDPDPTPVRRGKVGRCAPMTCTVLIAGTLFGLGALFAAIRLVAGRPRSTARSRWTSCWRSWSASSCCWPRSPTARSPWSSPSSCRCWASSARRAWPSCCRGTASDEPSTADRPMTAAADRLGGPMTTLDIVASVALILGALMSLLAGIAVLRFPDTMSRIHAATKPQVLGIMLLMLGVGLRLGSPGVIGMLVLIVILQFVTAPVSAHLTVRVAYRNAKGDDGRADEQPDPLGGRRRSGADGPGPGRENTVARPALTAAENRNRRRPGRGSVSRMSEINDLSNAYVAEFARLSPMMATYLGVPRDHDRLDDLSPDRARRAATSCAQAPSPSWPRRTRPAPVTTSPARSWSSGSRCSGTCTTRGGCTPT